MAGQRYVTKGLYRIGAFRPLINKKFKDSCYNEDVKSELTTKLVQLVKRDMDLGRMREINNFTLINYIKTTIDRHYTDMMKGEQEKAFTEVNDGDGQMSDSLGLNRMMHDHGMEETELFDFLKSYLTEREYDCVYYTVFEGYSSEELSRQLHITRQASNQCKQRAFEKLRKYYKTHGK